MSDAPAPRVSTTHYLPGAPAPVRPEPELDAPYWEGTRRHRLLVQRCRQCRTWQWGPEWICHNCLSADLAWTEISQEGVIYSYERVWHPVSPALKEQTPYVAVLVELPEAGGIRMIGNLLGDSKAEVRIGDKVRAVFEPHDESEEPYTLVQWERV